ncbi:hypothetical protein FOA52_012641 [Chlamydomonas sp. UWO 241]|nr:hypothetical protein FOA52_012641 [Chlamydomonas sp. UWO 241]
MVKTDGYTVFLRANGEVANSLDEHPRAQCCRLLRLRGRRRARAKRQRSAPANAKRRKVTADNRLTVTTAKAFTKVLELTKAAPVTSAVLPAALMTPVMEAVVKLASTFGKGPVKDLRTLLESAGALRPADAVATSAFVARVHAALATNGRSRQPVSVLLTLLIVLLDKDPKDGGGGGGAGGSGDEHSDSDEDEGSDDTDGTEE